MKVILFRSNAIFASRVSKYVNYYSRSGIDYTVYGWDRKGDCQEKDHYRFFRYKAGTASGGVAALKNHMMWMRFVYSQLRSVKGVTTVHACDLDSAFPAAFFKFFHNRKLNLIFDVCDWFSANFSENKIVSFLLKCMERFTCRYSNELIICEKERREQIPFRLKTEPLVLPNIPDIPNSISDTFTKKYSFNNSWPTFAYFGGFSKDRMLFELLQASEDSPFNLLIAGFGMKEVEELCIAADTNQDNVKYFGRVGTNEGLEMSFSADLIYACYSLSNPNHKYAAPNKYYEAMMLGKPLITNSGTILADKVIDKGIGYVIEEEKSSIHDLVESMDMNDVHHKGMVAKELWLDKYCGYLSNFFDNQYFAIIR